MCKWKTNRCECPVSYCTEGLEHFGSLEVEYYFSVPEKDAIPIIETVCKAVEEGLVIEDGVMYRDLFKNVSVFFFKTKSLASDKEVFRLVLPDWEGEYPCYTAFMIGLHSGCRVSEVFGLRWPDVDWDRNEIHVCKQLLYDNHKKAWYIAPMKTPNSNRYVPLSPVLKEYLLDLKMRQEADKEAMGDNYRDKYKHAYVEDDKGKLQKVYVTDFINRKPNGEWLTTSSIGYATRRREETTGKYRYVLNGEQIEWSFHDLRHTFATKAALSGVAISDLQRILGHSKQSTTERFYLHDEDGRLRINPERDRILFAGLSDMTEAINSCPETDLYAEHKAFAEKIETIKANEQKDEEIPDLNELDMSFENGIGYSNR